MKRYRGRGSFTSFAKDISGGFKHLTTKKMRKNIGGMAMGMAKGAMGMGAYYGGRGAYNNLFTEEGAPNAFSMTTSGDEQNDIIFSNREYIGEIYGNSSGVIFANSSYALNPGIEKTFPWLSQLAVNFTEYEFIQLVFEYEPTVENDIDSAGQTGTIITATQYNPDEPDFESKAVMLQYVHSSTSKVTEKSISGVECDPSKNAGPAIKYVRDAPIPTNKNDSLRYDLGTFQIAVHGTPTGYQDQPIGELYVTYTVRLSKPKLSSGIGKNISTDRFVADPTVTQYTPTQTNMLGSTWTSGS
jgi:hypothetical protein